jgi:hypothetical protein
MGLAIVGALVKKYRQDVEKMSEAERFAFVDRARTTTKWPRFRTWLQDHWIKHWGGRGNPTQYAEWIQSIKESEGTEVWGYIDIETRERGIAFINRKVGAVAWVSAERFENLSGFEADIPQFLANRRVTYWRIQDAEI